LIPKDVLSKEEIRKHLTEAFNKREIDEAFTKVDTNNSGLLKQAFTDDILFFIA